MEVLYKNNKIREICESGDLSKFGGSSANNRNFSNLIFKLMSFDNLNYFDTNSPLKRTDLMKYGLHKLSGDRSGQWAFKICGQIRIVVETNNSMNVVNILEVSKHYGD